jgi:hypothetical protein
MACKSDITKQDNRPEITDEERLLAIYAVPTSPGEALGWPAQTGVDAIRHQCTHDILFLDLYCCQLPAPLAALPAAVD